jgi:hypothetical protein
MIAAALRLGVPPRDFWQLSLREWRALAAPAETALSRDAFDAMTHMFPDQAP